MFPTEQSTNSGLIVPDGTIKTASSADLQFVVALQKKWTNNLGFLPRQALEWYLENRRVTLAVENDDDAGYLLGRDHFRWQPLLRPITQAAVCMDAQRRSLGLTLVAEVVEQARAAGQIGVQAMCASDIDAVHFWEAAGFIKIGTLKAANRRGREMHCYRKLLTKRVPIWFAHLPPLAGWKSRSTNDR